MRALLILLLAVGALGNAQGNRPITVCDILKNPLRWNGKMVEVAGPIMATQNYWIMGVVCDGAVQVKGVTFPSGLVLQSPSLKSLLVHKNVSFQWDDNSRFQLDALLSEASQTKRRVSATVVGMFETLVPLDQLIDSAAPFKYRGFGHMGRAPGQIIVKTVKGMRIDDKGPLAK